VEDDHDYGLNDGGREVTVKEASKEQILKFLDVPLDAEQYQHEGK
jgi:alkaline phosphatase D